MKKIFTLFLGIFLSISLYSQTYSYSFEGDLNPSKIAMYEKECLKFKQVSSVKIKYKPDSQKGEIIIVTKFKPKTQRQEGVEQFQPTDFKKFIINKGLSPLYFRELKK